MNTHAVVIVLGILVLGLSGCTSGDGDVAASQQGGAESLICADLERLHQTARKASTLNTFSSEDDARRLRSEIDRGIRRIQDSAEDIPSLNLAELEAAVKGFNDAVTRIVPGLTLGKSSTTLQSQAATIAQQEAVLRGEVPCI